MKGRGEKEVSKVLRVLVALSLVLTSYCALGRAGKALAASYPDCVGIPMSGVRSNDFVVQAGASPFLGVWAGSWNGQGSSPSFFIVRSVSGYDVDATSSTKASSREARRTTGNGIPTTA